jgi:hypothetical protein
MDQPLLEAGGIASEENVKVPCVGYGRLVLGTSMLIVFAFIGLASGRGSRLGSSPLVTHAGQASDAYSKCYGYLGIPQDKLSGLNRKPQLSAILTADPGDFSGVSEAHHILSNLLERHDKPRDETVCGVVSSGVLMGRSAIVVTTGIGPSAASMCTLEVMTHCGPLLSEVLYFGTSGWSPQPGGMLNPPSDCEKANWRPKVARLGDVCVSPLSVNWACHKGSWEGAAKGYPDQCYAPKESNGPGDTFLFGECQFYKDNLKSNLDLADDVIAAALSSRSFPPRSLNVTNEEHLYWSTMAQGVGMPLPNLPSDVPPTVWDYDVCMEVDAQFFYSGSPFEVRSRQYAADTLNSAIEYLGMGTSLKHRGGHASLTEAAASLKVTAQDVLAVTAMEAVGVSEALLRYNSLKGVQAVPFTNIRTLSNWNVQPITRDNQGRWVAYKEVPEDFITGYSHAIATGSTTILSYHQAKCLADPQVRDTLCEFDIDVGEHERLLRAASARH